MKSLGAVLPSSLILDSLLQSWLLEDIGRGDRTTRCLALPTDKVGKAKWIAKETGVVAGLPIAERAFQLLDKHAKLIPLVAEGEYCEKGQIVADLESSWETLLTGERTGLNLAMRLSGIATMTRNFVQLIDDLPAQFVDTRKTTPGLRLLEKYASQVGGAVNHRMGLDDAVMIKDNHIAAAGGIEQAIAQIRQSIPFPLKIEVETENLEMVEEAIQCGADIIMLDNMPLLMMEQAVQRIRQASNFIKIEASGNITLRTIRAVAETGVDYVSSSAPITQSPWLDLSMRIITS